jgi:hypothetical protein
LRKLKAYKRIASGTFAVRADTQPFLQTLFKSDNRIERAETEAARLADRGGCQKTAWSVLVLLQFRMLLKIQGRLGKVFLREKKGALWLSPVIFRYTHPSSTLLFDQGSLKRVRPTAPGHWTF